MAKKKTSSKKSSLRKRINKRFGFWVKFQIVFWIVAFSLTGFLLVSTINLPPQSIIHIDQNKSQETKDDSKFKVKELKTSHNKVVHKKRVKQDITVRNQEPKQKKEFLHEKKKGPQLAIVIDDMGKNLLQAQRLIDMFGSSCTFSILPYSHKGKEVANLAKQNDVDILLHLPMEPVGYPIDDPGPGALFISMNTEQIQEVIERDLDLVPGIVGVNNHMGSKFTAYKQGMFVLMKALKENELFFMDSLTSPKSKGKRLAEELDVPIITRDIFIDNEQVVESIIFQLEKAESLAKITGKAVALGHPYAETLKALNEWSKTRDRKVELCRLSTLVK